MSRYHGSSSSHLRPIDRVESVGTLPQQSVISLCLHIWRTIHLKCDNLDVMIGRNICISSVLLISSHQYYVSSWLGRPPEEKRHQEVDLRRDSAPWRINILTGAWPFIAGFARCSIESRNGNVVSRFLSSEDEIAERTPSNHHEICRQVDEVTWIGNSSYSATSFGTLLVRIILPINEFLYWDRVYVPYTGFRPMRDQEYMKSPWLEEFL